MEFQHQQRFVTGAAVPLSAVHSSASCGIGEYPDLVLLAEWCRQSQLDLIQILPINDTGRVSSPYDMLSSFALHPVYLRLDDIPGTHLYRSLIETAKTRYQSMETVPYIRVLNLKMALLRRVFAASPDQNAVEVADFLAANQWAKPYAVFSHLKRHTGQGGWHSWGVMARPDEEAIERFWQKNEDELMFYIWLQYHCDRQLGAASRSLHEMKLALKGDLPFLLNHESVEVWQRRSLFDLSHTVGAPPGIFAKKGQNWRFPLIRFGKKASRTSPDTVEQWWLERLQQAERFYHAFRIDHVLGFFRTWTIPVRDDAGILGHYVPNQFFSNKDLLDLGLTSREIESLLAAHATMKQVKAHPDSKRYLSKLGSRYVLRDEMRSETAIAKLGESKRTENFLLALHQRSTLLQAGGGRLIQHWRYAYTPAYRALPAAKQKKLSRFIKQRWQLAAARWEEQGRALLQSMRESTGMLICAEDLGAVPKFVPKALRSLGVLGLKVARWSHERVDGRKVAQAASDYHRLSVCTPSVHDSENLRQWWEENHDPPMTRELGRQLLEENLASNSWLCIFTMQDLFLLEPQYWPNDAVAERVNVPGTDAKFNWRYKLPVSLEELRQNQGLSASLSEIIEKRAQRAFE